jgi:hypothetical protein
MHQFNAKSSLVSSLKTVSTSSDNSLEFCIAIALALFVIPAMYTFLSRKKKHIDFGEETSKEPAHEKILVYEA